MLNKKHQRNVHCYADLSATQSKNSAVSLNQTNVHLSWNVSTLYVYMQNTLKWFLCIRAGFFFNELDYIFFAELLCQNLEEGEGTESMEKARSIRNVVFQHLKQG